MRFAELVAPVAPEAFLAEAYGTRPFHVPAPESSHRAGLLGWQRLNELLSIRSHWTEDRLRLILNSRRVEGEHYLDPLGPGPPRASPARVEAFLAMGASMVANDVHEVDPAIRAACDGIADALGGLAGANVYCSFPGIQAFDSHYDLSEVFVLQCEGEKDWRIYANREVDPVELPPSGPDGQRWIDGRKGEVAMRVRLRPGDVLYLPRGFYHDALAAVPSLHVTFSLLPHSGRVLFRLLEEEAMRDPAFRAYLPDGRDQGALERRLDELGGRIAAIARSPAFRERVTGAQAALRIAAHRTALPELPALRWWAATGRQAAAVRTAGGWVLRAGDRDRPLGDAGEAAAWALGRRAFSDAELKARFPHVSAASLEAMIEALVAAGAVAPCDPPTA